jgi:integrase
MSMTNLRDNYPKFLTHLEGRGYSESRVDIYRREIEHILRLAESDSMENFWDVYREYEKAGMKKSRLQEKHTIIRRLSEFCLTGRLPGDPKPKPPKRRSPYEQLCAEYKGVIDRYLLVAQEKGKKKTTIAGETYAATAFLLALQQSGVERLADVTESCVLTHFVAPDGDVIRRYSSKKKIEIVLKANIPALPECSRIIEFLPAFRNRIKNFQFLTGDEVAKIKSALAGDGLEMSLRDKAIITVALYTGLRSSDIAGLSMESVDWDNDLLRLHQQKTDTPLTLPLSALVGNAIYDYIELERPKCDCKQIFLMQRPYRRMNTGDLSNLARRFMKAIGIRQNPGDRQGLHLFRHHLATTLLGNGVAHPVITSITGHNKPSSLDTYLSADIPHLRECAISIEHIVPPEKVFDQIPAVKNRSKTVNVFSEADIPLVRESALDIACFPVAEEVFA